MILSFDIGGSKIAVGLVEGKKVFYFQKFYWQKPVSPEDFVKKIIEIISDFSRRSGTPPGRWQKKKIKFKAIALGVAGQVDAKGNVYLSGAINPNRKVVALKKILTKKFKLPVFIENDAHCFALGEAIFGQGKGEDFVVVLTLGTGIGGGIIMNKKILTGKDGFAGEFGHMVIKAGGEQCSCGQKGCFEAYASVTALKRIYAKLSGKKVYGYMIDEAFRKNEKKAILAAQEVSDNLALGLANIINILNPEVIVLGGGLSRFKNLMAMAIEKVKHFVVEPNYQTKILVSQLKDDAPLLGASLLVKK